MNTWSVEGGTGWYSVLLGQNRAVLVASTMSCQKIYGLHGLNHRIIEYSKKEKVITDRHTHRQTHRISSCRLDFFCRRGRVKTTSLKFVCRVHTQETSQRILDPRSDQVYVDDTMLLNVIFERRGKWGLPD